MSEETTNAEQQITYSCAVCSESQTDAAMETQDGPVCVVCANGYTMCDHCEERVDSDNVTPIRNGRNHRHAEEHWCSRCLDNEYVPTCSRCEERVINPYATLANGDDLCYSCYRDGSYMRCNNCDDLFDSDCINRRGYCEGCADDGCGGVSDYIYNYHHGHPDGLRFFGGPGVIHYGVELELELDYDTDLDSAAQATVDSLGHDRCHLEEDGSLAEDRSFEIISQPHTLEAHRELWKKFYSRTVRDHGFQADEGTGMHVHMQKKYLTDLQIAKMVVFINDPANEKFINCVAERLGTGYCVKSQKTIGKAIRESHDHYSALNTCTSSMRTIEMRIFKSPLTYDGLIKNLEFCDALMSFCKDHSIQHLQSVHFLIWLNKRRKQYAYLSKFLVGQGRLKALPKNKEEKEAMRAACA